MAPTSDGDEGPPDEERRRLLTYAGLAVLGGGAIAGGWAISRPKQPAAPEPTPTEPPTTSEEDEGDEAVPALVERYAPDLYFGALEKWYPTDPRAYVTETADGRVVDGFTALEEYSTAFREQETPPDPVVFYRIVEAAEGVDAIQYWFYSVFDQFTVNFHWHDWELLQVFVDRETGVPLLVSASAHSRASPNNEFLAPDLSGNRRLAILSEVGSHSSASEVNEVIPSFERLSTDDWSSDVTNDVLDVTRTLSVPFAYGLPRDEGARLPFVMPELDGHRLDEHPELSVTREDFVDERVTVGSWGGLPRPPDDIPLREPGLVIGPPNGPTEADATYTLEPMSGVRDAVEDFIGPQLSFEFTVPGFVEDKIAGHITSVGIPWEQQRFVDPLDDVTDPAHRRRIDGERPQGLSNRVVGRVRQLGSGSSGSLGRVSDDALDALDEVVSVSFYGLPVEMAVQLASEDPTATVTRDGVFGYLHVDPGDHRLTVNGPGFAPLALRFDYDGGPFRAGSTGELTMVAAEDAGWIRGDGRDTNGVARVRVIEDYAGVVYDGRPVETDRFAVAVHRDGHYTVEVVDPDGRHGAYRVTPTSFDDGSAAINDAVETGKPSLAGTLRDEIGEVRDLARSLAEGEQRENEVVDRLSRAQEEAASATKIARRGDADTANARLSNATGFLAEARQLLESDRQQLYSDTAIAALDTRIGAAVERADVAIDTELA